MAGTLLTSYVGLVHKVVQSLKDIGGASSEYQAVIQELGHLEKLLVELKDAQPSNGEASSEYLVALKGMALECQIPLSEFHEKLRKKYEKTLGARSSSFRSMTHKAKWSVFVAEEVTKLRAVVGAKVVNINLLLSWQAKSEMAQMRANFSDHVAEVNKRMIDSDNCRKENHTQSTNNLTKIYSLAQAVNSSVTSICSVANQLLEFFKTFSPQIMEQVQRLSSGNQMILESILTLQRRIPQDMRIADSFIFEDALGRKISLPYEYFKDWEVSGQLYIPA